MTTTDQATDLPDEVPAAPVEELDERSEPLPYVDRGQRLALYVFLALVAVAGPLFAYRGRAQWFFMDEWTFLANRQGGDLEGVFNPHQEHWTTLPVLTYRLLWNVFGIQTYRPYMAVSIATHLVVVILLRAVLRRMGVSPWMATAGAAVLLFYGTGFENVVWAFQITFTGALAFGLGFLLLADDPDPSWRRYLGGLACGLGALMCSGVGLIMLGVVCLALFLRRGWWTAARNAVPLLACYLLWWASYGRDAAPAAESNLRLVLHFAAEGLSHALLSATRRESVAALAVAVVVAGLVLVAWPNRRSLAGLRHDLAIPVSFALGGVIFFLVAGRSRVVRFGVDYATRGRFAYLGVAFLLPIVILGADAVARRWRYAVVPVVLLLVSGIPGNIADIDHRSNAEMLPGLVLAVTSSDALATAPPEQRPFEGSPGAGGVTVKWLQDGVANGKIPDDYRPDPDTEAEVSARLALSAGPAPAGLDRCTSLTSPVTVRLGAGGSVGFAGRISVEVLTAGGGRSAPREYGAFQRQAVINSGPPLTVRISPDPGPLPEELCR